MGVRHAQAALLPEREPGTYRLEILVGPQGRLGRFWEYKKSVDSAWNQNPRQVRPYLDHNVATAESDQFYKV